MDKKEYPERVYMFKVAKYPDSSETLVVGKTDKSYPNSVEYIRADEVESKENLIENIVFQWSPKCDIDTPIEVFLARKIFETYHLIRKEK